MTPTYMPFTYISPAVAETLAALVGPVVVYQPMDPPAHDSLTALSDQGKIQLRTPVSDDTDKLGKTLAELFQWGRLSPGKSTAGTDFLSGQKDAVPFFDETAVSRIRADIKKYSDPAEPVETTDLIFSARLFLAVAQENDMAVETLNTDLDQFKTLEQGFLDVLEDADTPDFDRNGIRAKAFPEDLGARQTLQRLRAWAMVAAKDPDLSNLWVTTSPAIMDTLVEYYEDALGLNTLATIHLKIPEKNTPPLLEPILKDLAVRVDLAASVSDDWMRLESGVSDAYLSVTLMVAVNHDPRAVIRALTPSGTALDSPASQGGKSVSNTLILLVRNRSES
ncbi:hypothetical protein LJC71_07535 [Desulfosarcina sp. OttesenSCG-928-A07]|nr:hypothetical protein [Desulfosarcina sp. OttesenSCG-928-G17]MDL2329577.1 hypothetical protein [Desulfosarcina sp. OttesenSCG-928-A07]